MYLYGTKFLNSSIIGLENAAYLCHTRSKAREMRRFDITTTLFTFTLPHKHSRSPPPPLGLLLDGPSLLLPRAAPFASPSPHGSRALGDESHCEEFPISDGFGENAQIPLLHLLWPFPSIGVEIDSRDIVGGSCCASMDPVWLMEPLPTSLMVGISILMRLLPCRRHQLHLHRAL